MFILDPFGFQKHRTNSKRKNANCFWVNSKQKKYTLRRRQKFGIRNGRGVRKDATEGEKTFIWLQNKFEIINFRFQWGAQWEGIYACVPDLCLWSGFMLAYRIYACEADLWLHTGFMFVKRIYACVPDLCLWSGFMLAYRIYVCVFESIRGRKNANCFWIDSRQNKYKLFLNRFERVHHQHKDLRDLTVN